ncbi:unnamed protein product [Chrysoparadoxa australica]
MSSATTGIPGGRSTSRTGSRNRNLNAQMRPPPATQGRGGRASRMRVSSAQDKTVAQAKGGVAIPGPRNTPSRKMEAGSVDELVTENNKGLKTVGSLGRGAGWNDQAPNSSSSRLPSKQAPAPTFSKHFPDLCEAASQREKEAKAAAAARAAQTAPAGVSAMGSMAYTISGKGKNSSSMGSLRPGGDSRRTGTAVGVVTTGPTLRPSSASPAADPEPSRMGAGKQPTSIAWGSRAGAGGGGVSRAGTRGGASYGRQQDRGEEWMQQEKPQASSSGGAKGSAGRLDSHSTQRSPSALAPPSRQQQPVKQAPAPKQQMGVGATGYVRMHGPPPRVVDQPAASTSSASASASTTGPWGSRTSKSSAGAAASEKEADVPELPTNNRWKMSSNQGAHDNRDVRETPLEASPRDVQRDIRDSWDGASSWENRDRHSSHNGARDSSRDSYRQGRNSWDRERQSDSDRRPSNEATRETREPKRDNSAPPLPSNSSWPVPAPGLSSPPQQQLQDTSPPLPQRKHSPSPGVSPSSLSPSDEREPLPLGKQALANSPTSAIDSYSFHKLEQDSGLLDAEVVNSLVVDCSGDGIDKFAEPQDDPPPTLKLAAEVDTALGLSRDFTLPVSTHQPIGSSSSTSNLNCVAVGVGGLQLGAGMGGVNLDRSTSPGIPGLTQLQAQEGFSYPGSSRTGVRTNAGAFGTPDIASAMATRAWATASTPSLPSTTSSALLPGFHGGLQGSLRPSSVPGAGPSIEEQVALGGVPQRNVYAAPGAVPAWPLQSQQTQPPFFMQQQQQQPYGGNDFGAPSMADLFAGSSDALLNSLPLQAQPMHPSGVGAVSGNTADQYASNQSYSMNLQPSQQLQQHQGQLPLQPDQLSEHAFGSAVLPMYRPSSTPPGMQHQQFDTNPYLPHEQQ